MLNFGAYAKLQAMDYIKSMAFLFDKELNYMYFIYRINIKENN